MGTIVLLPPLLHAAFQRSARAMHQWLELDFDADAQLIDMIVITSYSIHYTKLYERHFSDFSYRQISEVLQIPEKTVKSRLYSARQLMKDHLLAHGIQR